MSTLAVDRDTFAPQRPPGMRSGLALAIAVHVLLVLALAWSVNWKTAEPEGVVAELWSATPQIAAPRAAPPEPRPPEPRPPVVVQPRPTPPPRAEPVAPPREDASIAIERDKAAKRAEAERRDEARREQAKQEAARREEARRAEAERDKERERQRLADQQAEKKKLADKARQDDAKQAAIREANLRRMMAQAGTSDDPAATGNAQRTSGPSAGYAGRIKARIKPNILLTADVAGNPLATVEVRLAPDGTIVGRKLVKSSGVAVWDEIVLRAIDRTEVLPKDVDGRVPSSMTIEFKPRE